MAKFHTQSLVGFTSVVALLSVVSFNPPFAEDVSGIEAEHSLTARVATLEKTVAELRQQIHNDKLTSSLAGHYWVEESRIVAGEREQQSEEVAWRLSTEVSSDRYILGPEVSSHEYGPFSIDASKEPAWIDFEVPMFGQKHRVKGIAISHRP